MTTTTKITRSYADADVCVYRCPTAGKVECYKFVLRAFHYIGKLWARTLQQVISSNTHTGATATNDDDDDEDADEKRTQRMRQTECAARVC